MIFQVLTNGVYTELSHTTVITSLFPLLVMLRRSKGIIFKDKRDPVVPDRFNHIKGVSQVFPL